MNSRPLGYCVSQVDSPNTGSREQNLLSLSYGNIIRKDIAGSDGLLPGTFETYNVVEPGDTVLRLTDLQNDQRSLRVGFVQERGIITSAYVTLRPKHDVDPRFFSYVLKSMDFRKDFYALGAGVRQSLKFDELKRVQIHLPAFEKQRAIADHLDSETARIDALIDKKRRLARLIQERILQWERWLVLAADGSVRLPIASLFRISKGVDAQRLTTEYCQEHHGEYPVYSGQTSGAFGFIDTFDFSAPGGAIVVSTVGARVMSPTTVSGKFSLSQNCLVLIPHRPTETVVKSFVPLLRQLFDELRSRIPDHMQPSLRVEDLKGKWLLVPSHSEQVRLASEITKVSCESDEICQRLERQIQLLVEHRQALITSVVAGELEVPVVAA